MLFSTGIISVVVYLLIEHILILCNNKKYEVVGRRLRSKFTVNMFSIITLLLLVMNIANIGGLLPGRVFSLSIVACYYVFSFVFGLLCITLPAFRMKVQGLSVFQLAYSSSSNMLSIGSYATRVKAYYLSVSEELVFLLLYTLFCLSLA